MAASSAASSPPLTVARSVARLTDADVTPGTLSSDFSTRATQEAQVMPSISMETGLVWTCSFMVVHLVLRHIDLPIMGRSRGPNRPTAKLLQCHALVLRQAH